MVRLARILVPVDFSEPSDAAVEEAIFIARRFEAQMELLHVWRPDPSPDPDAPTGSLTSFARSDVGLEMRKYMELAESEGVAVRGRLACGDPEELILECADDFDLVVMGTHGRSGVSHVLKPSVAEHVVRKANVPVLTIHGPVERAVTSEQPATQTESETSYVPII